MHLDLLSFIRSHGTARHGIAWHFDGKARRLVLGGLVVGRPILWCRLNHR